MLWLFSVLLVTTSIQSQFNDEIVLYNTTEMPLYGTCYYARSHTLLHNADCVITGTTFRIEPCSHYALERPARKYHWTGFYDRMIYISPVQQDAQEVQFLAGTSLPISACQGSQFYIDGRNGVLQGYNAWTWNVRMFHEALEAAFCYVLEEVRAQYEAHPHSALQATIRCDDALCPEEQRYLQHREVHIMQRGGNPTCRVAFCASGGGYRAMMSTLGFLKGADAVGLLDQVTYLATLSGSTWAVAGYLQSGLSVAEYLAVCADHIEQSFIYDHDSEQVVHDLLKQFAFTQTVSLVDFYGALLAQKILKPLCGDCNPHEIDLAAQAEKIGNGERPFPLYTAVCECPGKPYAWVEFSPYEIGSTELGAAVPTWACGRQFYDGISSDFSPSRSLGFYMGVWGSALSANLKDVVQRYAERLAPNLVARLLQNVVHNFTTVSEGRLAAAYIPNWTAGTPLPYAHLDKVCLLDGGLACNIPFAPLLRHERAVDIIIVLDATHSKTTGSELLIAQTQAERAGLPFPRIDHQSLQQTCSVHGDLDDPTTPLIIYIPLLKHQDYYDNWDPYQQNFISTFNFTYTKEQMLMLCGLTEHCMKLSAPTIFETMQRVIARKAQLQVH